MEEKIENIDSIIAYWIDSSEQNYKTMNLLLTTGEYSWSLFLGHLVIEKLMKACVVKKTSDHAPFTHDLTKLAKITDLPFSEEHLDWLDTISTFNMNARYDSYKEAFYRKCTFEFTTEWIDKLKILQSWIKEKL